MKKIITPNILALILALIMIATAMPIVASADNTTPPTAYTVGISESFKLATALGITAPTNCTFATSNKKVATVSSKGTVDVNKMATTFSISKETIRRDLGDLEMQGVLKRTHGGAVLDTRNREYPIVVRGIRQVEEKDKLCRKAASLLQERDTIFVDNSSTLLYLARYIEPDMDLTILTNSINFLLEAAKVPHHNWLLICMGGILNPSNLSVYGPGAMRSAQEYYPDKAFFSCAGISRDGVIGDSSLREIEAKRAMIERSHEAFLLADSTKFKKAGPMQLCGFEDVNGLITTARTSPEDAAYVKRAGLNLIIAD